MRAALTAFAASLVLAGCATRPPIPQGAAAQAFVLERDLAGPTLARGEFRAINGVRRAFTARLHGAWDGRVFTLTEDFEYDDGERDRKTWRLTRLENGEWSGQREDVVGLARGFQDGRAFRLEYDVRLPSANGRGRQVRFRDVLVLSPEGAVLNNANVGLLGLRVARVELIIRREAAENPAP